MSATTYLDNYPLVKEPGGPRTKTALAVYKAGASGVLRAVRSLKLIVARQSGREAVDSSGPDCEVFEGQSEEEGVETAAAKGDDMCFTNTDSDPCNDAEVNDQPPPGLDDDLSRIAVPGSEEGSKPNLENEGLPIRKFRWAVTVEEEQQVRERVWTKMEQDLEESSRDDAWDTSKEHMQDLVTKRRDIQESKKRKQKIRKMRSVRRRGSVSVFPALGKRISVAVSKGISASFPHAGKSPPGCDNGDRRPSHIRSGELGEAHCGLRQDYTKVSDKKTDRSSVSRDREDTCRDIGIVSQIIETKFEFLTRAYRTRLQKKRDAVMRETIDPSAEKPMLTPAEWQGGWQVRMPFPNSSALALLSACN